MDSPFEVNDQPRTVAAGVTAETPLVTMAWRALRAEHRRRAEERQREHRGAGRVAEALANVAEEAHRLRRMAQSIRVVVGGVGHAEQLLAIAGRIESSLAGVELKIVAPEGEPFAGELMEFLENIAQQPDPEVREPRVAEVIAPAVIYRGALLRMGKAIISVPAQSPRPAAENQSGE